MTGSATTVWAAAVAGVTQKCTERGNLLVQNAGTMVPRQACALPSRGPERRLVLVARFDEPLSRTAAVGMSVGHRAAQVLDRWCFPCGPFDSLAFPVGQVGFGGLAGGEELPASRSAALGAGLELFAADAAGTDHGLGSVPSVAGVVDPPCRLLDNWHLLYPAARLGQVVGVGGADAGNIQVSDGGGVVTAGFRHPGLPPSGA